MKFYSLIYFLFTISVSFAQTPSALKFPVLEHASPQEVGMSPERLNKIDSMISTEVNQGNIPGAVALIARNGKIVYHKAYGMANNEKNVKMEKDAIFRIASQTKAITSTAVMMLWEEGKFQLDDNISKYIPEFGEATVLDTYNEKDGTYTTKPAKNQITIRDLLTHTSGIGYGEIDGDPRFKKIYANAGITDLFTTKNITIEESVKKLAKLPLHHEPGEAFTYSEGLDVLGYFIEIISGMPFDEFLRTRIFEPLNMDDTWFYQPKKNYNRLVTVQKKENDQWIKYPVTFYDTDYPIKGSKTFFSGGAGLSSTAKDYAKFLQMYLNNGEYNGIRLLSRTTVRSILGNQIGTIWNGPKHHGLAFSLVNEKGEIEGGLGSAGTFEWGGYFNTQYFADPKENVIGIIMKQTRGPVNDVTGWKFKQMLFASIDD
ncbi:CubicO group peptidase, beta-lactamase class C family [Maribacter sedimenticola]|uniref:CubicO group peptidase, beta-lactamase class C family n=1 Tax=Maribacter sedimenticola TaxID=228956 RepID=A0ABY1SDJ9_9FLAO|nr:serine hydrolase domain-containing protein [Maribacter sedimenticola]SNR26768.1 CubicO group peptidase, beta-lactamase class C family [Maribacter sedimenticola]